MTTEEFIAAEAAKPFVWGETDCASTADRWVRVSLGFSPLACFGRVHGDEAAARTWLAETPLPIAVNRVMRACGLGKTDKPRVGDVGLIWSNGKACVAIKARPALWFSRDETGLIMAPFDCVWKAWSIV